MDIKINNLFHNKYFPEDREYINKIFESGTINNLYAEHIISFGHASPEGFWYDQEQTEWVALLKGQASLLFHDNTIIKLSEGDYITIPKHTRHRVETVSNDAIWLAFFIK